jgi:hypothetical protein
MKQSVIIRDDVTANFHGGNARSVEAHESTIGRKDADFLRILELLRDHPDGLTCDEAERLLAMSHQTCSARFADMKRRGWISPNGPKRPTRNGCNADVCVETPSPDLFDYGLRRPKR